MDAERREQDVGEPLPRLLGLDADRAAIARVRARHAPRFGDRLRIGDQTKHILGYLQDFLFTPDRARQPVRSLSGGERARLPQPLGGVPRVGCTCT